jgi:RNA polymerase sigma factor (sigma-70 family)
MPRLQPGEDPKIDKINALVADAKSGDTSISEEGIELLLKMFHPLILGLCKKWSIYFNDDRHNIKPFDELVADAQYWFIKYTMDVYEIDGSATYNNFIKSHLDQRIRYIYEREIKYYNRLIFPDPDKHSENNDDVFDDVIYKYSDNCTNNPEDEYIDGCLDNSRNELAHTILSLMDNNNFSDRERLIFKEVLYYGFTHEAIGSKLGISRTRVTQILKKTKNKLYKLMEDNEQIWKLIGDADITIEEEKW